MGNNQKENDEINMKEEINKINKTSSITIEPFKDKSKNISFGGDKEKEMINKFNAFDILWYASEDSEELEKWIAFTNVNVTKTSDMNIFYQMALKSRLCNLIIISSGSFAEKTFPFIDEKLLIGNIIIYCMNSEYHKKWSKKYKSIIEVCTKPSQIFEFLLQCHIPYNIPFFNYKFENKEIIKDEHYTYDNNTEIKINKDNFSFKLNDYEKFCAEALRNYRLSYINYKTFFESFMDNSKIIFDFFYTDVFLVSSLNDYIISFKDLINNLKGLTLLSLYFSKFPFLFGVLNYLEIESILNEKSIENDLSDDYIELSPHLLPLIKKLEEEKISILDETSHLKFIQTFLIKCIKKFSKMVYNFDEFSKFPTMIKYLEDFDFCLKYFFFRMYGIYKDHYYRSQCRGTLDRCDKRIPIFYTYCSFKLHEKEALKIITKDELDIINETLIIKNFIVIGNKEFYDHTQKIESLFIPKNKKLVWKNINEVKDYFTSESSPLKLRNFSYIIIINFINIDNYIKILYSLKKEFALDMMLIAYVEDDDILINKQMLMELTGIPIFISDDFREIKNFIISQQYCNCSRCFIDFSSNMRKILNQDEIMKKHLPIIKFEEKEITDKLNAEDGWELVDSFPKELFNLKFLSVDGTSNVDTISFNLFKLCKENKIESEFFKIYCKYFNFSLLPEILCSKTLTIILKQICFAYTLSNISDNKPPFYYLMNRDLRSGDFSKIEKFLNLISAFNSILKYGSIKSYKGDLYRGSKLDKNFIKNNLEIGKVITNACFWSASKSRDVAESFLWPGGNILFVIKSKGGNNIDIDEEKLSYFSEKEVLFLPFCKFLVKNKKKIIIKRKEFNEVEFEEIENINEIEKIKSYNISMEESYEINNLAFHK